MRFVGRVTHEEQDANVLFFFAGLFSKYFDELSHSTLYTRPSWWTELLPEASHSGRSYAKVCTNCEFKGK